MLEKPKPPEGYKLLDGWFEDDLKVKQDDLTWNLSTKEWNKVKISKYRGLGIVKNYWYVARKI